MTRRRHSEEFKAEAVKLLLIDGISDQEAAKKLGISPQLLYHWKAKHLARMDAQSPAGAQSAAALSQENEQLRKALAKERRMNEILKKTVGYFSKDT